MGMNQEEINKKQTEENTNTNKNINYVARSLNHSNSLQGATNKLQEHINEETKENIKRLYDHAEIANKEMGEIKEHITGIHIDLVWLKKFLWAFLTPAIGVILTALLALILR